MSVLVRMKLIGAGGSSLVCPSISFPSGFPLEREDRKQPKAKKNESRGSQKRNKVERREMG